MSQLPLANVVETPEGLKYILFETNDCISQAIKSKGAFEPIVTTIAEWILNTKPAGCVIDIGANIGAFTIPLAKKFSTFTFECFEVQRPVYYQLCGNVILNALSNVVAHHVGVSDAPGSMTITLPDYAAEHNVGCFSLDDQINKQVRADDAFAFQGDSVDVNLIKLDSMKFEQVALIKIDVEGLELVVIRGALGTIVNNHYPPIIYEAWENDWYDEKKTALNDFLVGLGYQITQVGMNNIAQHPNHGAMLAFKFQ